MSIALGERPGTGPLAGIALALVSIVLVSQQDTREGASSSPAALGFSPVARAGVGTALASGVAIGLFFLAIARTRAEAGLWPLVAARGVSFVLFTALALYIRRAPCCWREQSLANASVRCRSSESSARSLPCC